ncbi:MAG: hypothetical protein BWY71_01856 [Planctomycetes bacterium ADurb.Bin412]|nr:MAG: hypothetical protein BWY71_01856 [Planctomycetes bacterium ADurb.Bin412]
MSSKKNTREEIQNLISQNRMEEALQSLQHSGNDSLWYQNARAVCLMRSGEPKKAAEILSGYVYKKNTVVFNANIPLVIKINCVTAMLLEGNVAGALNILNNIEGNHALIQKVRDAVRNWRRREPLWRRISMRLGMFPFERPVRLDFTPGEIDLDGNDSETPTR